jgi:hypothetical protein
LKDADYQTPQDNYFGYLQRMKSQDEPLEARELAVLRYLVPEEKLFQQVIRPLVLD